MNSNISSQKAEKPDIISWLLAVFSISVLLLFSYYFVINLEKLRLRLSLQKIFHTEMKNQRPELFYKSIADILSPAGLASLRPIESQTVYSRLYTLIFKNLDEQNFTSLKSDLHNLSAMQDIDQFNQEEQSSFPEKIAEKLESLSKEQKNTSQRIEQLKPEINILKDEFTALKKEILVFFGLSDSGRQNEVKFYQAGLLQGLPALDEFPDNIPEAKDFAEYLEQAKGRITFGSNENNQEFFNSKLELFRDKGFQISISYPELSSEMNSLSVKKENNEKEYQKYMSDLLVKLKEITLLILKTNHFL